MTKQTECFQGRCEAPGGCSVKAKLTRRAFLKLAGFGVAAITAPSMLSASNAGKKPNVIIIITDQQRYDALGCHGGQVHSPNLDRLARQGADLQMFFSQAPVCVPSRCNIFTGRYGHSHRVLENNARLAPGEIHLFKALKQNGYRLGYVGKNHLLDEKEFKNFDFVDLKDKRQGQGEREQFLRFKKQRGKRLADVGSWASAVFHDFDPEVTDPYISRQNAIKFVDEASEDRPWGLVLSFADPHVPHVALRKYESLYPLDQITLPKVKPGVLDDKAARFKIKQKAQGSLDATDNDRRLYRAVYYAMISWVDENIGAVLKTLDDKGLSKDTIIVFTSDHGDFNFQYNMCKKDLVLLDALVHVNCLISWRGHIKPQVVDDTMAEQIDLMPTLLELCDIDIPFGCQGKSLDALLKGKTPKHKDVVYGEICYPWMRNPYKTYDEFMADWKAAQEADEHLLKWTASFNVPGDYCKSVRTMDFKYIWYADGFEELYDLRKDPREEKNVAASGEYNETLRQMRMRLLDWELRTQDPLDPQRVKSLAETYDKWQQPL